MSNTSFPPVVLSWSRALPEGRYELCLNNQSLGWLRHGPYWNSGSLAEFAGQTWVFRRPGSAFGRTDIYTGDQPQSLLASYKSNWGGGGTLTFRDGSGFMLTCTGFWHHLWALTDANGATVLRVDPRSHSVLLDGSADLTRLNEANSQRLLLLIVFVWHEVLQAQDEADMVAVMSATS